MDEKLIPAGTALASCGIAFAMRYIRAAMEGGVELGFRPEEAARIVEHTVKGAATLLLESGEHPEAAIDKVTTAGGITIKGLNAMESRGFTAAVIDGLKASNA
jgi:pyrroline-5-carboxylate reductase